MKIYVVQSGTDFLMNGLNQVKVFATRELAEEALGRTTDPYGRKWEVREAGFYES